MKCAGAKKKKYGAYLKDTKINNLGVDNHPAHNLKRMLKEKLIIDDMNE